jgi:hypothetical protein
MSSKVQAIGAILQSKDRYGLATKRRKDGSIRSSRVQLADHKFRMCSGAWNVHQRRWLEWYPLKWSQP